MIALCHTKCFILHLREESCHIPNVQRGLKGNVIVFPQCPSKVLEMLPPSVEEIITPICVLFIGSCPPMIEWLCTHAKPLIVRREKVRSALEWLCEHNKLYADVTINHDHLDLISDEDVLPVHIKTLPAEADQAHDALTSRYDNLSDFEGSAPLNKETVIDDVLERVTNVDGGAPAHELHAAALHHVKEKSGGFIQVPHGSSPMNEYVNPELLPKIYPTLFPYGIGGFEHPRHTRPLSFKHQSSIHHLERYQTVLRLCRLQQFMPLLSVWGKEIILRLILQKSKKYIDC
ncbi:hypothetical protein F4604DRAFT_1877615 [Suillus subluteus]|nr:hypothetical protein F4604DRAFT_1877615 [Suillus subluteus]